MASEVTASRCATIEWVCFPVRLSKNRMCRSSWPVIDKGRVGWVTTREIAPTGVPSCKSKFNDLGLLLLSFKLFVPSDTLPNLKNGWKMNKTWKIDWKANGQFKQVWRERQKIKEIQSPAIKTFKYKPMSHNLLLFLWRLSYGLRTQNTLPQETGNQDFF